MTVQEPAVLLLALVFVAAFAAVLLWPLLRERARGVRLGDPAAAGAGEPGLNPAAIGGGGAGGGGDVGDRLGPEPAAYERVVRVVSSLFLIAAFLLIYAGDVPRADDGTVYGLILAAWLALVFAQDVLPARILGRWRYVIEAGLAIGFVTVLVALTGGHVSPFFFGYLLILAGASLSVEGAAPILLALAAAAAYLLAVGVSPRPPDPAGFVARVGFNLVALGLLSYLAAVVGREQRRAREAAVRLSRFDTLTGLYNRSYFNGAIEREIQRAARTERAFSLLMLDLDGLKPVNDRFGHESGDRLLVAVAAIVRDTVRVTDLAARYGGDEFVVLLPETDLDGAWRVAEKLRIEISELTLHAEGGIIRTSVSIGLVSYPEDGRTAADLMRKADLAMYESKRRGRDQVLAYPRAERAPAEASRVDLEPPVTQSPAIQPPVATAPAVQPPAQAARRAGGPVPPGPLRAPPPAGVPPPAAAGRPQPPRQPVEVRVSAAGGHGGTMPGERQFHVFPAPDDPGGRGRRVVAHPVEQLAHPDPQLPPRPDGE